LIGICINCIRSNTVYTGQPVVYWRKWSYYQHYYFSISFYKNWCFCFNLFQFSFKLFKKLSF
jgi:hypothetical protein